MVDPKLQEKWARIEKLMHQFSNEMVHDLAAAWEDYVNSLPKEMQESVIANFSGLCVTLKDIPKLIRTKKGFINILLELFG